MTFRALVEQALDAADVAPDSAAGRIALDRAKDVHTSVLALEPWQVEFYRRRYHWHVPRPKCPQIAAVNLVLLAVAEAARGVRVT